MNARNGILLVLGSVAVGGILGVLFAPQSGCKTRSLMKDKTVKYSHDIADLAGTKSRHVVNKAKGYVQEVRGVIGHKAEEPATVMEPKELAQT